MAFTARDGLGDEEVCADVVTQKARAQAQAVSILMLKGFGRDTKLSKKTVKTPFFLYRVLLNLNRKNAMFNNIAFDVVIGMIFVFLLYSLLATILQEIIAHFLHLRARMLYKALRRMLQDEPVQDRPWWTRIAIGTFIYSLFTRLGRFLAPHRKGDELLHLFYSQPTIKYLGENVHNSKPSYLHADNFSLTLLNLLRGAAFDGSQQNDATLIKQTLDSNTVTGMSNQTATIPNETLAQLKTLFADAHQDANIFKAKLEEWFNETMERASGWYKKQTQVILFLLGLFVALLFNVDTIATYRVLAHDKMARNDLVQMAVHGKDRYSQLVQPAQQDSNLDLLTKTYASVKDDADKASSILGLGRPWKDSCRICDSIYKANDSIKKVGYSPLTGTDTAKYNKDSVAKKKDSIESEAAVARCAYIRHEMANHHFKYAPMQTGGKVTLIGWLLTALAISLGSPFWFDMLNKVINLRSGGPKPAPNPPSDKAKVTIVT
jgi:hypothetical protein